MMHFAGLKMWVERFNREYNVFYGYNLNATL